VQVVAAAWVPWASVTFTGARHRLTLALAETAAAETWLAALPEADLPLLGHLLADLQVLTTTPRDGRLYAVLEALTVEEC
jgi:hypothetical protein